MSSQHPNEGGAVPKNPIEPSVPLQQPPPDVATTDAAHPPQPILPEDSAVTKAEKVERHGLPETRSANGESDDPPAKRIRLGETSSAETKMVPEMNEQTGWPEPPRRKGVASIKREYLIDPAMLKNGFVVTRSAADDDAAEGAKYAGEGQGEGRRDDRGGKKDNWKKDKKQRGQNTARQFGSSKDTLQLCSSVATYNEFEAKECRFGNKCKFEHSLRKYLSEGKRPDLETFKVCPNYETKGKCNAGWKCRLVGTHSEEREHPDGRKELVLKEDAERIAQVQSLKGVDDEDLGNEAGNVNVVSALAKMDLNRRKTKTPKADAYLEYMNKCWEKANPRDSGPKPSSIQRAEAAAAEAAPAEAAPAEAAPTEAAPSEDAPMTDAPANDKSEPAGITSEPAVAADGSAKEAVLDNRASYIEPPFLPSEKRRLYYGPETPVLAPLTTQGNLPFRRLCVSLGAQVTWSEMAMSLPLIQGNKSEWALVKAHESEATPPTLTGKNTVVEGYDNAKDMKFGVQIAGNKPWNVLKATEVLTALCPHLRAIDLNCGCPIDLVYKQGAGSALLDARGKLEKMLRGMNAVSNEVPITVKIRMGVKDNEPTADRLVERLVLGSRDARAAGEGPCGVAAITLHGRSRQQRYTRSADWGYISDCAALINRLHKQQAELADTANEADPRHQPNGGKVYFVGNGDCYSHADYYEHMNEHKVDSVMVARGALIKPWVFEEIQANQYLDKSSSERLRYIETFVRNGLETWGSDEMGVGTTRRFLLEWLSFACRYTPIGLLEHLPPNIQDRAPAFKGRDEMETLMASDNYRDWIKISEMFLGKAPESFSFQPKHKSNAYEAEG